MAESKDKLKEQLKILINTAKRIDLEINSEKTEYIVVQIHGQVDHCNECLEFKNYKFRRVH